MRLHRGRISFAGLLLLSLCFLGSTANAAQSAKDLLPLDQIDLLELEGIDLVAVKSEDELRKRDGLPARFAIPFEVDADTSRYGTWELTDRGSTVVWRLRVASHEASSLNFGFSRYLMPPGGQLFIYSPDGKHVHGPYSVEHNQAHGQLWTPVIQGSEAVIELSLPADAQDQMRLVLGSINHGYRFFGAESAEKSGSCNVDVVCPEGNAWRDEINSVGAYSRGGSIICTGAMVNNTARNYRPYFLTANHCGVTSSNAASVVIYWRYENSFCRAPGSAASGGAGNGGLAISNSGTIWRAASSTSDFTLLELSGFGANARGNVYYAGWNRGTGNPSSAVAIHHPRGDEKRISFENNATTTTSYLSNSSPGNGSHIRVIDWDLGTTEPGSSGSPLFDQNQRIVGQLHGGYAACGNNSSDWYGRLSTSWNGSSSSNRLRDWLDPGSTGAITMDGEYRDYLAISASLTCWGNYSGSSQVSCMATATGGTGNFSYNWSYGGTASGWSSSGRFAYAYYFGSGFGFGSGCNSSSVNFFWVTVTDNSTGRTAFASMGSLPCW